MSEKNIMIEIIRNRIKVRNNFVQKAEGKHKIRLIELILEDEKQLLNLQS